MANGLRGRMPIPAESRAIALALRRRVLPDAGMRGDRRRAVEPDETLLQVMEGPFESVTDVRKRLQEAEAYLRRRSDRRSVFLTVYTEMTAKVEAGIEAGRFDDPSWAREYLIAFADRYRAALVDFERGSAADLPQAWQIAFTASTSDYTLLVQDALLGINAHINYDLAFALEDIGIDPDRSSKLRDHDRINAILRQLVDVIQRALADVYHAEGYTHVDDLLGSFDEDFTLIGLTEARSLAWRNAVLLTDTRSALVRRIVDWRIDAVSAGAGYFVLAPSVSRSVLWTLRGIEGGSPPIEPLREEFQRRAGGRQMDL